MALQCKINGENDKYIVEVLLPEALVKICMRVYKCSKEEVKEFLEHDNIKNCFKCKPKKHEDEFEDVIFIK